MLKKLSHRAALAGFLVFGLSASAFAVSPPSAGLGQAWPNTVDVSPSPNWHAYVFMLGGVKYVQINDINGNVLGAVGTSNGQFITLPIGRFSQLVATPQEPAAAPAVAAATTGPTTVYQDSTTRITATILTNGTVQLTALNTAACDPIECNNGGVKAASAVSTTGTMQAQATTSAATCDPIECNNGGAKPASATTGAAIVQMQVAKSATACDPIECNNGVVKAAASPVTGSTAKPKATSSALACDPIECNNGVQ